MKKKVLTCMVVGSLAVALGTASAFATSAKTGNRYEDRNGDGICDNYNECPRLADDKADKNRTCPKDGNGNGKCLRNGTGNGNGKCLRDGTGKRAGKNAGNDRGRGCGRGRNR